MGHERTTNVYTDGSSRGNGQQGASAGYGVYYGSGDSRNTSQRLSSGPQTNQRAELSGVNHALRQAQNDRPAQLNVHSDSTYAIKSMTSWGDKWETNGYRTSTGAGVQNQDLISSGRSMINDLASSGTKVNFYHTPGHSGHYENEQADYLATQGSRR